MMMTFSKKVKKVPNVQGPEGLWSRHDVRQVPNLCRFSRLPLLFCDAYSSPHTVVIALSRISFFRRSRPCI